MWPRLHVGKFSSQGCKVSKMEEAILSEDVAIGGNIQLLVLKLETLQVTSQ